MTNSNLPPGTTPADIDDRFGETLQVDSDGVTVRITIEVEPS